MIGLTEHLTQHILSILVIFYKVYGPSRARVKVYAEFLRVQNE